MDIDERLDRLTQRHEALTQYIELMVREWSEWNKDWHKKSIEWNKRFDRVETAITGLTNLAASHEKRLNIMEGK